ncbi:MULTISPECIES: hypothetical protein [Rhodomicrobium]|uniref:hypothetical protein n=1 Tax=Rhodomicrobium TaxID=1068 RepID=UPI000B4A955E|nr:MULTISPECIES: hypothetical protein [Rhodomicrobium]
MPIKVITDALNDPLAMFFLVLISFCGGIAGTALTMYGRFRLSKRQGVVETNVRAYKKFGNDYLEIYKIAREVELSLIGFYYISQKESASGKEFAVLAYELLRRNALQFIEKLDWRRYESVIYLPTDVELRCVRIRSQLFEGLGQTTFRDNVKARQFQDNRLRHGKEVDLWALERLSKKGKPWQKVHVFKTRELINTSPFMDEKVVKLLQKDLDFVLKYLKVVFTQ